MLLQKGLECFTKIVKNQKSKTNRLILSKKNRLELWHKNTEGYRKDIGSSNFIIFLSKLKNQAY